MTGSRSAAMRCHGPGSSPPPGDPVPWPADSVPGRPSAGLSYYGYRWFDPLTGRWPSRDPMGERGELNLYGYTSNHCVGWIDVLGRNQAMLDHLNPQGPVGGDEFKPELPGPRSPLENSFPAPVEPGPAFNPNPLPEPSPDKQDDVAWRGLYSCKRTPRIGTSVGQGDAPGSTNIECKYECDLLAELKKIAPIEQSITVGVTVFGTTGDRITCSPCKEQFDTHLTGRRLPGWGYPAIEMDPLDALDLRDYHLPDGQRGPLAPPIPWP